MLFNPNWTKSHVVESPQTTNLKQFIAWLEKQPQGCTFDYTEPMHCAVAQWRKSLGFDKNYADYALTCPRLVEMFGSGILDVLSGVDLSKIDVRFVPKTCPTFGECLSKTKAFLAANS